MIIEILYKEIAMLYGDQGNIDILKKCLPDVKFIYTTLTDVPYFINNEVNLVLMGPTSESDQLNILNALMPYKKEIKQAIKNKIHFLLTGNAVDIFGKYILDDTNLMHPALDILDFYVKQDLWHRYNGFAIGHFQDFEITGHKSQFSMIYGDNQKNYFFKVERGIGINLDSNLEGFHVDNLYATHLLGPILVLNPLFLKHLLADMGVKDIQIPFEKDLMNAYNQRVTEFNDEHIEQIK